MFRTIQNIVAMMNSYGNGKLLERKRGKSRRRSVVRDRISISEEARERLLADGDETTSRTEHAGRK